MPLLAACVALMGAGPAPGVHRFYSAAISPDGSRVASIEADQPAEGGEATSPALMIRMVEGGGVTKVALPCEGAKGCGAFSPVWAPDGKHLAFGVRGDGAIARAIYTSEADGGNLQRVLAFDGTIVALHYGPDGRLAALGNAGAGKEAGAARAGAEETGEIGAAVHEQRIGIVSDGALQWASPADLYVYEYDWRPDGRGFVGTAAPGDGDANWWTAKLYAFDDAKARVIHAPSSPRQQIAQPKVSPDGATVSFIGGLMSDFENPGGDVFVMRLAGDDAAPRNLTEGLRATATTLRWGCQPGGLVASMIRGADTEIAEIDAADGRLTTRWSGQAVLNADDTSVSLQCGTPLTAAVRESFARAPELVVGRLGYWRDLTTTNAGVAVPFTVRNVEWSSDGAAVQGWLLTPPGAGKFPMITVAHGGPAAAAQPYFFGPGFNRTLLDHGYALFMPNPRGSYGQGETFTQATAGDLGHGDFRDILAGVDAAIRAGPIDAERLGITGVSYGAFMTLWATTQTQRFKAAVARAGISDWLSYYGENGIGGWLKPYFGASVYDDPAVYARSSPINFVKAAKTPTLLMVGERDIECPPPQSREFWHALRELGVRTQFVVYPGEGHDYWSSKTLTNAEARAIAWFDQSLR